MNISLTPHFERLVHSKISSGRFQSASEVVREGLRLLEERDEDRRKTLSEVREKLAIGYAQLQRGEGIDGESVFEEIRQLGKTGRARRAKK